MEGLTARDVQFSRQSEAITLQVVISEDVANHIKIAKVGLWPDKVTAVAENPIALQIEIVESPADRPEKSITWSVNDVAEGNVVFILLFYYCLCFNVNSFLIRKVQ